MNLRKSNPSFRTSKLIEKTNAIYTTYYPENVPKIITEIHYNIHNKPTIELRYDENNVLKQRITKIYDDTETFEISAKFENGDFETGLYTTFYTNQFDSNGLVNNIIERDINGKIIQQTKIIYNEKGDPTEITVSVGDVMLTKQTAMYNYELNEATLFFFNREGKLLNSQIEPIDYSKAKLGEIVNKYGDIIKTKTSEIEITYDEFGNWTKKIYTTIIDGKWTKSSEQIRTLVYVK